ncbi:MAG: hypothetical protein ACI82S_002430 [Patiriisocius sp.]|jgi:hypothetical protein
MNLPRPTLTAKLIILLNVVCCCINSTASAQTNKSLATNLAEVVWIERDDSLNHILFAAFDGVSWKSRSTPLYSSRNPLATPTIGTKKSGEKLVLWTEQKNDRATLFSILGRPQPNNSRTVSWTDPTTFSNLRVENLAANVLVDINQKFWVFWSASGGEQSDVFFTRELLNDWTSPSKVNDHNVVPDSQPIAHNDIAGNVVVEWLSFDLKAIEYVGQSAIYSSAGTKLSNGLSKKTETLSIHAKAEQNLTKIDPPTFLPDNLRICIHFPQNKLIQSILW